MCARNEKYCRKGGVTGLCSCEDEEVKAFGGPATVKSLVDPGHGV